MTRIFAEVNPQGRVLQTKTVPPGEEPSPPAEGNTLVVLSEPVVSWDPDTPTSVLMVVGTRAVWVERGTLEDMRAAKSQAMSEACAAHILAGFECDALGSMHVYPAKIEDQLNLTGVVTDSLMEPPGSDWTTKFWCANVFGVWEMRSHTVTQIQAVGRSAKAAKQAAVEKNDMLQKQIQTASAEQLASVAW